jgi:hypothetical protein
MPLTMNDPAIQKMIAEKQSPEQRSVLSAVVFPQAYDPEKTMYERRGQQVVSRIRVDDIRVFCGSSTRMVSIAGHAIDPSGRDVVVGFDLSGECWYPAVNHRSKIRGVEGDRKGPMPAGKKYLNMEGELRIMGKERYLYFQSRYDLGLYIGQHCREFEMIPAVWDGICYAIDDALIEEYGLDLPLLS